MKKFLMIMLMLSGCAIINDEKQGAYFSQFSIPTKKLLGVGRCKSFENKYVENYDWDKLIKLETEILNVNDKLKTRNGLSSVNIPQANLVINSYLEMPSVFYRDKKMKDLSERDGETYDSYGILNEVAGFCLKNDFIQDREKTTKLKSYWAHGEIKAWMAGNLRHKLKIEQNYTKQKAEFMKTFNKSKLYGRVKKSAPSMIGMPVESLVKKDCKIEDVIIGMSLLSMADNRFSKQENYSFSVKGAALIIKVSDIFRINFEQRGGKLVPIEFYSKNENNPSDNQDYTNRSVLGAVYMSDTLCGNSELVY